MLNYVIGYLWFIYKIFFSSEYGFNSVHRQASRATCRELNQVLAKGLGQGQNRVQSYTDVINGMYYFMIVFEGFGLTEDIGYYDGATELYKYSWGQSFHFS
jgi:hypothetical protein